MHYAEGKKTYNKNLHKKDTIPGKNELTQTEQQTIGRILVKTHEQKHKSRHK